VSGAPDVTRESILGELRPWIAERWDPDLSLVAWRRQLVEARWATPSWPERWHGRAWPVWADDLVAAELASQGAVGIPIGVGMQLAAPTILAHGPEEARERWLASILTGEQTWCQLFSEPGAGSDLAGLTTGAELDGDEWVLNGQKVWNTSAHHAQIGLLLARTDWDAPKHHGITCFALPMEQPGVLVRPLRQMNGHASFNEVFLTDARVPVVNVIGQVGNGWSVARTTLANERRFGATGTRHVAEGHGRALEEARREADEHFAPYVWYPQRAGRVDLLVERAQSTGRDLDPVTRQAVARVLSLQQASRWTAERARSARAVGRQPGPEGSIGKLALSEVAMASARAHTSIGGLSATLAGDDAPLGGVVTEVLISVPAQSIAGGTDEIQRNILAEKILGLPREPSTDQNRSFRELPRNL
jgi:alkylation response protein AidB-like acyl-CoA dehydrogenase